MNRIKENKHERQFLPFYIDRMNELVVFKDIHIFNIILKLPLMYLISIAKEMGHVHSVNESFIFTSSGIVLEIYSME